MNKKYIITGIIGLLLFSTMAILLCFNKLNSFDSYIYNIIISCKSDFSTILAKGFSYIGSTVGTIIIIGIALLVSKNKRNIIYIIISSSIAQLLNYIVKIIFVRDRPTLINMLDLDSYSFPSGHAMCNLVLYGLFIYLLFKKNFKYKYIISILFILLILFIGISRIYLGVHFASDVIGGFGLGLLFLSIYIYFIKDKLKY